MFGSPALVRGTARFFRGRLLEAFNQGDRVEGLRDVMRQIPETAHGVCKSLCMHWVDHHANDRSGLFSEMAKSMATGGQRSGGYYGAAAMTLNQLAYTEALRGITNHSDYNRAKDQYTDDFLRKRGILRQMKISNPALNLSDAQYKLLLPASAPNNRFGKNLADAIVGEHSAKYWSYKIISIHGRAGGHAIAAFVGADVMFFDPNYGIFYFPKSAHFKLWFADYHGFYWKSGYAQELGDDCVIKSYAKGI